MVGEHSAGSKHSPFVESGLKSRQKLHVIDEPRPCPYLAAQRSELEYRLFAELQPAEVEWFLERGWRRFGPHLFRPVCKRCRACVPIRVDVARFQPTKSQRRCLRRNAEVRYELAPPALTQEHLKLYNLWHEDMTERRDWPLQQLDASHYAEGFLAGRFPSLQEIRYWEGDRLVGVGLVDLLPQSLSSAYFFHDPQWRPLGPGTYSILCELELARSLGLRYLYLGYWIADCQSMAYKNRFQPAETLTDFVGLDEIPVWEPDDVR